MSTTRPPAKKWRVYGARGLSTDYRSQRAAYDAVASITNAGTKARVWHWEDGSWRLYEQIEPARGGSEMSAKTSYAESVVGVLREHFPDLTSPITAEIVRRAVDRNASDPHASFEVIVDNPSSANWRLKGLSKDPRRVHLACYRMTERDSDVQLMHTVNDALSALEVSQ